MYVILQYSYHFMFIYIVTYFIVILYNLIMISYYVYMLAFYLTYILHYRILSNRIIIDQQPITQVANTPIISLNIIHLC